MDEFQIKRIVHWIFKIVLGCICMYLCVTYIQPIYHAFIWILNICKPLLLGFLFAIILDLPLQYFERKLKIKRWLGIILSYIFVIVSVCIILLFIIPEMLESIKTLIQIVKDGLDYLSAIQSGSVVEENALTSLLAKIDFDWMEVRMKLESWFQTESSNFILILKDVMKNIGGKVISVCIGIVFSVYILVEKEKIKKQIKRMIDVWIPKKTGHILTYVVTLSITTFQQFIIGQISEAILLGTLCAIGMIILNIPYALMIGVLVGVSALIPYVGAILGTLIGMLMIVMVNPWKAIVFLVYILILQQIDNNFIYPKVVGKRIQLPAIWVFASITIGGSIAGPIGMIFSVPIVTILYKILKDWTVYREKQEKKIEVIQ